MPPSPKPAELKARFAALRSRCLAARLEPLAARLQRLRRLERALREARHALARAMEQDFHKPAMEFELAELNPVLAELRHAIRELPSWVQARPVHVPWLMRPARAETRYEPKGVALVLAPWNYPVLLLISPLVSALAAGNGVMLKPSEKAPATAAVLQTLVDRTFAVDEAALVQGGRAVSQALLRLPFDHVFFTGSTAVGRKVMAAAARIPAPVTLELGGKSPAVIDATADLGKAARRIAWGKFVNAGQTCVAPDYVLVEQAVAGRFMDELKAAVQELYGADEAGRLASRDACHLIDLAAFRRLKAALGQALARGARLELGGSLDARTLAISPTLLSQVPLDCTLMRDEIFGPILPVLAVPGTEAAIRFIQERPKPLALYVFSRDRRAVARVLAATEAGGSVVNNTLLHLAVPGLPFGGISLSGLGSSHGWHGFRAFSHARAVFQQHEPTLSQLAYPPYRGWFKAWMLRLMRWLS